MCRDGVKAERTSWRDMGLSARHRLWGFNCPMVDIDFLAVEFESREPAAIIDYKHERNTRVDLKAPGIETLGKLGDRANLPVFVVHYSADYHWWRVYPVNSLAMAIYDKPTSLKESDYVKFLYSLRGRA